MWINTECMRLVQSKSNIHHHYHDFSLCVCYSTHFSLSSAITGVGVDSLSVVFYFNTVYIFHQHSINRCSLIAYLTLSLFLHVQYSSFTSRPLLKIMECKCY